LPAIFDVPPKFLEPVAAIFSGKKSTHLSFSEFSMLTKTIHDLSMRFDMKLSTIPHDNDTPHPICGVYHRPATGEMSAAGLRTQCRTKTAERGSYGTATRHPYV
jgi:hypothetical protein